MDIKWNNAATDSDVNFAVEEWLACCNWATDTECIEYLLTFLRPSILLPRSALLELIGLLIRVL